MDGGDDVRRGGVVAENAAQLADGETRGVVGDGDVGPDGGEQLVAGDEDAGARGEVGQDCEGFGAEGDDVGAAVEKPGGEVEAVGSK